MIKIHLMIKFHPQQTTIKVMVCLLGVKQVCHLRNRRPAVHRRIHFQLTENSGVIGYGIMEEVLFPSNAANAHRVWNISNLRILKKKCPFPNLEPSAWMDTPGKINATARLDKLERDMNDKYNTPKHSLVWNRKLGKEPKQEDSYGKLWCRLCGRTFAWRYRHNNLPKTVCRPLDDKPCPPEWVTAMTAADVNQDMPMHGLSVSTKFARARQGIG